MTYLLYARHGLTADQAEGRRNTLRTPLVADGRWQMRQTGIWLLDQGIWPDTIVCSQFQRAHDAAVEIALVTGYPLSRIVVTAHLNERDVGAAKGLPGREIKRRWPNGIDYVPGAEGARALQARADASARWLMSLPGSVVLAVGHGVHGRALARSFRGDPYTNEYLPDRRHELGLFYGGVMRMYPDPTATLRKGIKL